MKAFWNALPEEFEAKDFKATAQEVGLSIPTAERYIRQWLDPRLDKVSQDDTESGNYFAAPAKNRGCFLSSLSRCYTLLLVIPVKIAIFAYI